MLRTSATSSSALGTSGASGRALTTGAICPGAAAGGGCGTAGFCWTGAGTPPGGGPVWARNPAGRLRGSRNKLSEEVICALLRDFREHGQKAIAKVRRDQPGVYLKVLALLIPRQDKLEHTNTIKTMTDEELESAIAFLHEMMAAQAVGSAHLVEMKAEPAALPAPGGQSPEKLSSKRKPNRLMMEVDTAIGPQERIPRKMRPPAGE